MKITWVLPIKNHMSFYQLKITWVPIENHLFCLPIIKITCICSIAFFNICVHITLYIIVIYLLPNTNTNTYTNTNSMFVQNYLSQIKKGFHLQKLESSLNIEIPYCQEASSPGLGGANSIFHGTKTYFGLSKTFSTILCLLECLVCLIKTTTWTGRQT